MIVFLYDFIMVEIVIHRSTDKNIEQICITITTSNENCEWTLHISDYN